MSARSIWTVALLLTGVLPAASAQDTVAGRQDAMLQASMQRATWRHATHYGKWLTAGAVAGFTVLGAREHSKSRENWNDLLAICRTSQDACNTGPDGRYLREDAEQLFQTSRRFDRRANHWLLGAQASLLATAVLFILDLRTKGGPDNIPFSPLKLTVAPTSDGAVLGMSVAF